MQLIRVNVLLGMYALFLIHSSLGFGQYVESGNAAQPFQIAPNYAPIQYSSDASQQNNAYQIQPTPVFSGQGIYGSGGQLNAPLTGVPNLPVPPVVSPFPAAPFDSAGGPFASRNISSIPTPERIQIESPNKALPQRSLIPKFISDTVQSASALIKVSLERKSSETESEVATFTSAPVDTTPPANLLERPPTNLAQLLEVQTKIKQLLPRLLPTVVSIEGGSGIIVSPQGHILSVSHVSKRAHRAVIVKMADGRTIPATTLGSNVNTDTGALKLVGNGPWPFVSIQAIPKVEKGDWCLALGYPLSFKRGSPAALRVGRVLEVTENRIVTDCPIMGGDSGGPLFDLDGNLIAISSRVKRDINQNLHVTINNYHNDWQNLVSAIDVPKSTNSNRSYLGVIGESDFGLVRIKQIIKGSPAEQVGLMINDVILQFGGKQITKFDDVLTVLSQKKPGETVTIQLNRYGSIFEIPIRLSGLGGQANQ